jgi:hypothetical protein
MPDPSADMGDEDIRAARNLPDPYGLNTLPAKSATSSATKSAASN